MDPKVASELSLRLPHLGLRMAEHSRRALAFAERLQVVRAAPRCGGRVAARPRPGPRSRGPAPRALHHESVPCTMREGGATSAGREASPSAASTCSARPTSRRAAVRACRERPAHQAQGWSAAAPGQAARGVAARHGLTRCGARGASAQAVRAAQAGGAVAYPGLPSHPQHALLQRLANPEYGFGGLLTLARPPLPLRTPCVGVSRLVLPARRAAETTGAAACCVASGPAVQHCTSVLSAILVLLWSAGAHSGSLAGCPLGTRATPAQLSRHSFAPMARPCPCFRCPIPCSELALSRHLHRPAASCASAGGQCAPPSAAAAAARRTWAASARRSASWSARRISTALGSSQCRWATRRRC